jgi:hypothetical protein
MGSSMKKVSMAVTALNLLSLMKTMAPGVSEVSVENQTRKTTGSVHVSLKTSALSTKSNHQNSRAGLMFAQRSLPELLRQLGTNNSA